MKSKKIRHSFLDNTMRKKDPIIETFSAMASNYEEIVNAELQQFWGWDYYSFVNTLLDLTEINEGDHILDIATGTAVLPLMLSNNNKVVGLDITFAMLENAKVNTKNNSRIELICGSALSLPIKSEVFDLITCVLATHHLDMRTLLSEMKRALKNSGSITIADVCIPQYMRHPIPSFFLKLAAFLYFLISHGIYRAKSEASAVSKVRTQKEWIQLADEGGFTNIEITQLTAKYAWLPGPLIMTASKL